MILHNLYLDDHIWSDGVAEHPENHVELALLDDNGALSHLNVDLGSDALPMPNLP